MSDGIRPLLLANFAVFFFFLYRVPNPATFIFESVAKRGLFGLWLGELFQLSRRDYKPGVDGISSNIDYLGKLKQSI